MNADLQLLIRLQATRDRIADLTAHIETEIPSRIADLDTELSAVRERLLQAQAVIEGGRRERTRLEVEMKGLEEKVLKYKTQLMQVRTNEEYRAALNEIDYANRGRSDIETRVLMLMEEIDVQRDGLKEIEEQFRAEDGKIRMDRKVLEDERERCIAERAAGEMEAARIEGEIRAPLVATYKRIAAVRNGMAIARAEDGVCVACNMRLRPSIFQQVKLNSTVITCESCKRILYYEPPAPTDEPPGPAPAPSGDPPPAADGPVPEKRGVRTSPAAPASDIDASASMGGGIAAAPVDSSGSAAE